MGVKATQIVAAGSLLEFLLADAEVILHADAVFKSEFQPQFLCQRSDDFVEFLFV